MKPITIKLHLETYSIVKKRKSTLINAFASAIAPIDEYDGEKLERALEALGQTHMHDLACVYCSKPANTWDHLTNLVKNGELHGFGHQIGNLVPCCNRCNSKKGGKSFAKFIDNQSHLDQSNRENLKSRLIAHQNLALEVSFINEPDQVKKLRQKYDLIKDSVFKLLTEADEVARQIRIARQSHSQSDTSVTIKT